ncbi:hypothetical protein QTN25_006986 [Entamoeba marina]
MSQAKKIGREQQKTAVRKANYHVKTARKNYKSATQTVKQQQRKALVKQLRSTFKGSRGQVSKMASKYSTLTPNIFRQSTLKKVGKMYSQFGVVASYLHKYGKERIAEYIGNTASDATKEDMTDGYSGTFIDKQIGINQREKN